MILRVCGVRDDDLWQLCPYYRIFLTPEQEPLWVIVNAPIMTSLAAISGTYPTHALSGD